MTRHNDLIQTCQKNIPIFFSDAGADVEQFSPCKPSYAGLVGAEDRLRRRFPNSFGSQTLRASVFLPLSPSKAPIKPRRLWRTKL